MGDKKQWDLTSTHSLEGAAGWIRKRAGASLVLVIRPQDVVTSIDEGLEPLDVVTMVRHELPQLLQHLIDERARRKAKG